MAVVRLLRSEVLRAAHNTAVTGQGSTQVAKVGGISLSRAARDYHTISDNNNNQQYTNNQQYANKRSYFTNTDQMKKDDPYAQLGLQYGDATSTKDIKEAFRKRARLLHPDVNTTDTPAQALHKFQQLQKAYETLLQQKPDTAEGWDEWRFAVWRNGDVIAQDRTDVAGVARKRPAQPASKAVTAWAAQQSGHPQAGGITTGGRSKRGELLGTSTAPSSSVGTGKNKWVTPKELKPWNPETAQKIRASHFSKQQEQPRDE